MKYEELISRLSRWDALGHHEFGDGVTTIGGQVGVFPQKWVHTIFPALPKDVLADKTENFPFLKGFHYYSVLEELNGAKLFGGALYLFGCYSTYRKVESPGIVLDIYRHNLDYFESFGKPFDAVVIGAADFGDVRRIYSQTADGTVLSINFETKKIECKWPTFDAFLISEIERLDSLASLTIELKPNNSWQYYEKVI